MYMISTTARLVQSHVPLLVRVPYAAGEATIWIGVAGVVLLKSNEQEA
jgi:hypothetical protein